VTKNCSDFPKSGRKVIDSDHYGNKEQNLCQSHSEPFDQDIGDVVVVVGTHE